MRESIKAILELGRVPDSDAEEAVIQAWENAVKKIERPVTDVEAIVLLNAFPETDDDCYGLVWTLLHACETAPGYSVALVKQSKVIGEWKEILLHRLNNAC